VTCSVIATIICVLTSSEAVSGRQTPPVFHTGVSLVHLDVEVTDAGGRIITGLSKADFRVFDEDAEQPLVVVAGEDQPLDVILLFDTSGSIHSVSRKVAAAGHDAFSTLRPGDRVAVMAFDTDARLLTPLTNDFTQVEESLSFLSKDSYRGGTRIQDAVDNAATRFVWSSQDEQRRRAVLVVTDNLGRRAKSEQAIVEDFWESDTLLSAFIIPKHKSPAALIMGREPGGVDRIVEETGGDLVRTMPGARSRTCCSGFGCATDCIIGYLKAPQAYFVESGWHCRRKPKLFIQERASLSVSNTELEAETRMDSEGGNDLIVGPVLSRSSVPDWSGFP
jgi:von Willebrand factor type A domain